MLTPIILVADHQNLFIEGLTRVIKEKVAPVDVIGAATITELVGFLKHHKPQLIFLNFSFIHHHFHNIRPILAQQGYPEIIAICDEWTEDARKQAASLGALSVLSKNCSCEDIWQALERTICSYSDSADGETMQNSILHGKAEALTARQRKILQLLSCGLTNREISSRIGCAETTVKAHLNTAYKILGVKNRTQAMYLISQTAPLSNIA